MQETQEMKFQSLGGENTHSSILAWEIPWAEGMVGYGPWDHKELNMTEWMSIQDRRQGGNKEDWNF